MSTLSLPMHVPPIGPQHHVLWIASLLALAFVASSIEQCRIIPAAFSKGFSTGFDVQRKVCNQLRLGHLIAGKVVRRAHLTLPA
jgi:hypothetical protein